MNNLINKRVVIAILVVVAILIIVFFDGEYSHELRVFLRQLARALR